VNWQSKLLPVRVWQVRGYTSDIVDGMRWAVGPAVPGVPANPNTAKVLNVSLAALGACDSAYQSAIDAVLAARVPVIAAAGNNGGNAANYSPANCVGQITVGALDRNGGLPGYGNTGAAVTLAAPGGIGTGTDAILSTSDSGLTAAVNDHLIAGGNGTSISTAYVTGIVSLMQSLKPGLLPVELRNLLVGSVAPFPDAVALGSPANCNVSLCGAGRARATAALQATQVYAIPGPQVVSGYAQCGTSRRRRGVRMEQYLVQHPARRCQWCGNRRGRGTVLARRADGGVSPGRTAGRWATIRDNWQRHDQHRL
jgi:serine protease